MVSIKAGLIGTGYALIVTTIGDWNRRSWEIRIVDMTLESHQRPAWLELNP